MAAFFRETSCSPVTQITPQPVALPPAPLPLHPTTYPPPSPPTTPLPSPPPILNLSSYSLNPSQYSLLSKGLGFVPSRLVKLHTQTSAVDKLARTLKIKHYFSTQTHKNGPNSPLPKNPLKILKSPSTWLPPPSKTPLEIDMFRTDLSAFLQTIQPRKPNPNLPKDEHNALLQLKSLKDVIIKPADKGSTVVLQDRELYNKEGFIQLSDSKFYKPLQKSNNETTVQKINQILKEMLHLSLITKENFQYLSPKPEARPRLFYLLPKIHKPKGEWRVPGILPKGRPIVSDVNSISYETSKLITLIMEPFSTSHPSYLKDTSDFLDKLPRSDLPDGTLLVTMDVESLYTNIDTNFGLNCVRKTLSTDPHPIHPYILQLLELTLNNNEFLFDQKLFLQLNGTPMGARYSVAYANIVMAHIEAAALNTSPLKPLTFLRFIDDIFCLWPHGKESLQDFIHLLNNQCPTIKVTANISDKQVEFLDLSVVILNNKLEHKPFFKPTDSHQLLHTRSFHPKHTFRGILKSQLIRLHRNSSKPNYFQEATRTVFNSLVHRGYSRRYLRYVRTQALQTLTPYSIPPNRLPNPGSGPCGSNHCKSVCPLITSTDRLLHNQQTYYIKKPLNCNSKNIIYVIKCTK